MLARVLTGMNAVLRAAINLFLENLASPEKGSGP